MQEEAIDMAALYDFLQRRDTYANWMNNNPVLPNAVFGIVSDSPDGELWLVVGNGVNTFQDLTLFKIGENSVAGQALRTLTFMDPNDTTTTSGQAKYNFACISGTRNGVAFSEFWILVNATYNYTAARFQRIDYNGYSFGIQMQAGGTYPGEEGIGDYDNQAIGFWKANGKNAYPGDDDYNTSLRNQTNANIGADWDDGNGGTYWREFGIMLGWNNVFMLDSYGGMTIGGAGFEIDGAGMSPFKRVSLGKFSGGSDVSGRDQREYVFGYNGNLWNAQHGFFNKDVQALNGYFWGMKSGINWYESNEGSTDYNPNSDRVLGDDTDTLVWMINKGGEAQTIEHWITWLAFGLDGNAKMDGRQFLKAESVTTAQATDQTNGQTAWSVSYPAGCKADNSFVACVVATLVDNTVKQIHPDCTLGASAVTFSTSAAKSVKVVFSRYADAEATT